MKSTLFRKGWAGVLLCCFFMIEAHAEQVVNLVPESPATAANYWCTWYA
jgi:hypothetical protein